MSFLRIFSRSLTCVFAGLFACASLLAAQSAPAPASQAASQTASSTASTAPVPAAIQLWPNGAPGALGDAALDKPTITPYIPAQNPTHTAIVICPGGGYEHLAITYEGNEVAQWLNARGVAAFVLTYRLGPRYHHPVELLDAQRAIRYVRSHAAEDSIDPSHIGIWGFSAGGHLASTAGTHFDAGNPKATDPIEQVSSRPDFMVLAYPVISMEKPTAHSGSRKNLFGPDPDPVLTQEYSNESAVTADTPPTFIFATTNDPIVPVENSLDFYRALERAHVSAELHLFDYGNHGCGLCGSNLALRVWPSLLRTWLIDHSFLPPDAPPLPAPEPNWPVWPKGFAGPGQF